MKKILSITLFVCAMLTSVSTLTVRAWKGMRMPELFIKGRYLMAKDMNGNDSIVNLHGFGQTYSPYFNGYAWCKNADGSVKWDWDSQHNASNCTYWNKTQISSMLQKGWKVNWIRIHMDPFWSNKQGIQVNGESDISAFDSVMFKKNFDAVFLNVAQYAIRNGIYVVMRPPGVCPEEIKIGDDYQKYLIWVWKYVANHKSVKNNPHIMFELANEPVRILGDDGQYTHYSESSMKNCTKYFQAIVDAIRSTGANNILWVPGLCWQQNYQGYVKYPIKGENIGFAVHCYPGWYGSDAEESTAEVQQVITSGKTYADFQAGWSASIDGVAKERPILVTEMDWAPKKYNSSWGKATTGELGGVGFGANFRYIMDKTGNVSWMLFTDAHKLAQYDDNAPDGDTFLTSPEACPRFCFRAFEEYADPKWKFEDILSDNFFMFPGTTSIFSPSIWEKGTLTKNADGSRTLITGQYGFGGWKFANGLDMSGYKYLVLNLAEKPVSNQWSLRLFDADNYWGDPYMKSVGSSTRVVVTLASMKSNNSKVTVDPSHIYILGLWSLGGTPIKIKSIYLTNNSDYSEEASGIGSPSINEEEVPLFHRNVMFNLQGQQVKSVRKGQMYILNGKKYIQR